VHFGINVAPMPISAKRDAKRKAALLVEPRRNHASVGLMGPLPTISASVEPNTTSQLVDTFSPPSGTASSPRYADSLIYFPWLAQHHALAQLESEHLD
jgi:hypothetical protein